MAFAQAAGIATVVIAPDCQHPRFAAAVARHHSLPELLQTRAEPALALG